MNDLLLSFQISLLGMGLVFGAILLLWLMMVLLTRLTADKKPVPPAEETRVSHVDADERHQAAAIAVAAALAEQELFLTRTGSESPTAIISVWQLGMRTSQMYEKGTFRRR